MPGFTPHRRLAAPTRRCGGGSIPSAVSTQSAGGLTPLHVRLLCGPRPLVSFPSGRHVRDGRGSALPSQPNATPPRPDDFPTDTQIDLSLTINVIYREVSIAVVQQKCDPCRLVPNRTFPRVCVLGFLFPLVVSLPSQSVCSAYCAPCERRAMPVNR